MTFMGRVVDEYMFRYRHQPEIPRCEIARSGRYEARAASRVGLHVLIRGRRPCGPAFPYSRRVSIPGILALRFSQTRQRSGTTAGRDAACVAVPPLRTGRRNRRKRSSLTGGRLSIFERFILKTWKGRFRFPSSCNSRVTASFCPERALYHCRVESCRTENVCIRRKARNSIRGKASSPTVRGIV